MSVPEQLPPAFKLSELRVISPVDLSADSHESLGRDIVFAEYGRTRCVYGASHLDAGRGELFGVDRAAAAATRLVDLPNLVAAGTTESATVVKSSASDLSQEDVASSQIRVQSQHSRQDSVRGQIGAASVA
jgi:hypothetical protein